jgi:hypothetical protein
MRILHILFKLGEWMNMGEFFFLWIITHGPASSRDVLGLWNDPAVREYLTRNGYKLEHLPGLYVFAMHFLEVLTVLVSLSFLSDVDRIVSRDYTPTDGTHASDASSFSPY